MNVGELFATVSLDDSGFQSTLGTLTKSIGKFVGITSLFTLGKESIESYAEFESAFTGVMKTVDETANTTYEDIEASIIGMAEVLPATTTEIAGVMEAAGQLGISADYIEDFTRVMIDMGESTNLSANDAATTLARFANIMGTSHDEFSNLSSAIVDLGNNYATTEREIAEMAMRMAGAGAQAGMSEADILGFAAAMSSVGLYAEAGGSAFSTFVSGMISASSKGAEEMADFAAVAGMSAEEFKSMFDSDAAAALSAFFTGLGKMEDATVWLGAHGYDQIRMRDMLLRTSGAADMLAGAIDTANTAYEENSALTIEAEKRYATLDSQFATTKNNINEMFRQFGETLLPAVQLALDAANSLIDGIQALFNEVFVAKNFDGAVEMIGGFAENLGNTLVNFLESVDWVQVSAQVGELINVMGEMIGAAAGGLLSAAKTLVSKLIEYMLTPEFWVGLGVGLTNILDGIFGGIMGVLEQALGGVTGEEQGGEIDYTLLINADGQVDVGQAIDLSRYHGSGDAMIQYLQDNGYLPKGAIERYDFALSLYPNITFEEAMDNTNYSLVQSLLEAGMDPNLAAIQMPVAVTPDVSLGIDDGAVFEESISQSLAESGVTPTIQTPASVEVSSIQAVTLSEEAVAQFGEAGTQAGQIMSTNVATAIANTEGIAAAIDSLASAAETAASTNMKSSGINAGKMFSSGIASGILSGKGIIANAARKVAQAAIDAANAKLQIASPSRVMEKSGGFFSEGFARGIWNAAQSAVSAASGMASMAANAATIRRPVGGFVVGGASAYGGGAVIDYDRMAEAMSNYQMVMNMDGKRVAKINARNAERAQNSRRYGLALGYGMNRR
ncbi:MAG: phage tail tape measure protein [Clostridia bacterium]|nr:phage tail tape measure protein [Clostridia bacterium]